MHHDLLSPVSVIEPARPTGARSSGDILDASADIAALTGGFSGSGHVGREVLAPESHAPAATLMTRASFLGLALGWIGFAVILAGGLGLIDVGVLLQAVRP